MAKRFLFILIVIVAMLSMQGCNKTWSQTFNSADDLDDWEVQILNPPSLAYVTSDGLFADGNAVHAPYGFKGDFTMEILFDLHVTDGGYLPILQFVLAGGEYAYFTNYISSSFYLLGHSAETYVNEEASPVKNLSSDYYVPGIRRNGSNTYKLVKTGTRIQMYMNGSSICDKYYTNYPYLVFFPSIYIDANSTSQIAIKSIKVTYGGDTDVYVRI